MNKMRGYIMDFAARGGVFGPSDLSRDILAASTSRASINTCLSRLVDAGKLSRVGHGLYTVNNAGQLFNPTISEKCKGLYAQVRSELPYAKLCVYEGQWLTPFMHHIAINNAVYVEAEKYADSTVFEKLKASGETVFLKPDSEMMYNYVDLSQDIIIVKPLISQSPLQDRDGIIVSTIEKLLVDLYCDKDFYYLQGAEYYHIMNAAQDLYALNKAALLRYAGRRNVREKIAKILEESKYDID